MNHATATADDRAPRWALVYWLALVLLALPPETFPARQSFGSFRFLDYSYRYGLVDSLRHDQWAGRDILFNYGPLFQVVHGLGLLLPPHDAASIARFDGAVESLLVLAMCWGVAQRAGASWRVTASFFAAWAVLVGSPGEFHGLHLKPMGGLWPLAVGAAGWMTARESGKWSPWWSRAVWMLAPLALLAYSFEMGPLLLAAQVAAVILAWGASLGIATEVARDLRRGAVVSIALLIATVAVVGAVAVASTTFRTYLVDSWGLTTSYAASWAAGGGPLELALLAVPPLVGVVALIWCFASLRRALADSERQAATSVLVCLVSIPYAVALVRYGLTRSDIFHVWRALAPTAFVAAVVVPCRLWRAATSITADASGDPHRANSASIKAPQLRTIAVLFCCVAIVPWLFTSSTGPLWVIRANLMAQVSMAPARAEIVDPGMEKAVAVARQAEGDSVAVWPYGALVNVLAEKRNPNPIVHFIEAHNPRLSDRILARLADEPETPILLYPDPLDADSVSSLSRTDPRILQHMIEHYELASGGELAPGGGSGPALLVRRGDGPRLWRLQTLSAEGAAAFVPGDQRGVQVALHPGGCRPSDMLLLDVRATPIRTFGFRKPGRLVAVLLLDDGSAIKRPIPLPIGDETRRVAVAAFDNHDPWLPALFTRRPRKAVAAGDVRQVQLTWLPLDPLSVAPAEIRLESAQVLSPADDPGPAKMTVRREQWTQPRVWREIFAPAE